MNRFEWEYRGRRAPPIRAKASRMELQQSRPSGPPGYGRRHGSKDTQLKSGTFSALASEAKTRRTKDNKPPGGPRSADEAVVSVDAAGQHNPLPSQGPLGRCVWTELASTPTTGLKPYWGKPAVRNFRGGRGNVMHGLMPICHAAPKGGYSGRHWPTHRRASSLLGTFAPRRAGGRRIWRAGRVLPGPWSAR